jgi:hypothetical protein
MNHLTETQLNEFLDKILGLPEQGQIENHLSACADCRSKVESMQSLFQTLNTLQEEELENDLASLVLKGLPEKRIQWAWKLVLAVQAGIALGLTILVVSNLLTMVSLQTLTGAITLKFPLIELPVFRPSSLVLPTIGIQTSTFNLIFLAASVLVLWGVGNAALLRNRKEGRK